MVSAGERARRTGSYRRYREGQNIRILVTGGAGFIGSHIIERLLDDGHEVVCLDNFDPYYDPEIKKSNIQPFLENKNFTLEVGDIRNRDTLTRLLEGTDYVFHEAAQAGVRISVEDPIKPHEVNATGTLNLLEASRDSGVKKIINASSSSVYGTVEYLPFDEDHPRRPVSPYGVSKLAAEEYCRVFSELYGLKSVSLRYFTVYGPRMRPDLAISIFTRKALANEPITIFGDGTKTRDFTNIKDIVRANLIAMQKGEGAYNIGGGHRVSIQTLAETIIETTGSSSEIRYADTVKGDAEHTFADTKKAERNLGWRPQVSLEEGLRRYAAWVSNSRS
ncbi:MULTISPECIES: SDR family oxidoreductase [Methanoculleus]|uniref:NAD-dependent epimerase/dehydratase n=2 Tax=Methanoculleus TaxID=45989 RepID=A3CRY8_METMJ|nr:MULTISPECIES: SDR family oxidoreductase [Methanoculleus]ABN56138.1 NAD-dependent epimerase/dehydratase [Methanoculleus marisnigri JR1]UYU17609.1 SDR family oxidoreductase [Methanoculleus submarinus]